MSYIEVHCNFFNYSELNLVRGAYGLDHGEWDSEPPEIIEAGATQAGWRSDSDGFATGTAGFAEYSVPGFAGVVHLTWNDPFSGGNDYSESAPEGFTIAREPGGDGTIAHVVWDFRPVEYDWSQWYGLGGDVTDVSVVNPDDVPTDIYAIGTDGELWQKWWDGHQWNPGPTTFDQIGDGQKLRAGGLSVITRGASREIFAIDHATGQLLHKIWDGTAWSQWFGLGGDVSDVSAVIPDGTPLDIYVIGQDGYLWQKWWDGHNWNPGPTDFTRIDDSTKLRPGGLSVITRGGNRDVFAIDNSTGQLLHKIWNGTAWSQWYGLGGNVSDVSVVTSDSRPLDIYVIGADGELWQKWWDGHEWNPGPITFTRHSDGTKLRPSGLSVVADGMNRDVFAVGGSTGRVIHKMFSPLS